jgi:sulfur relay (sulfurtransferase) complex TusBCD TusD component (DsrE family)
MTKLAVVIYSTDPETILNALELSHHALKDGDEVRVLLLGRGLEGQGLYAKGPETTVVHEMKNFVDDGGQIFAPSKYSAAGESWYVELCQLSGMSDMYKMIKESDTVVTL